jgi:1-aminocyclopropane-1-carboxylate deaminase/D-cysteine desulfhydrase-like pyridoxal-dependent ACC family enzyme
MQWLAAEFDLDNYLVIPEGGANAAGILGCMEIVPLINTSFDYVAVACGTGTTLAGIVQALKSNQKALGFAALKGGQFLSDTIEQVTPINLHKNFTILDNYHFGGYAKFTPELLGFIDQFEQTQNIKLDFVYTAKMMFGIFDLIQNHYFAENATIVAIHSGGLQGNQGIGI